MFKYVFLFSLLLFIFIIFFKFMISFLSRSKSSPKIHTYFLLGKKAVSNFFIFFVLVLIISTSSLYLFLGRSDLLRTLLRQHELEENFTKQNAPLEKKETEQELFYLYDELQKALLVRSQDIKGYRLLVTTSVSLKKYTNARKAQERVIQLLNKDIGIKEYILYLEIALIASGGRISLESSRIIKKAFLINPKNETLLFFKALEHLEKRNYNKSVEIWKILKDNKKLEKKKLEMLEFRLANLNILP